MGAGADVSGAGGGSVTAAVCCGSTATRWMFRMSRLSSAPWSRRPASMCTEAAPFTKIEEVAREPWVSTPLSGRMFE